MNIIYQDLILMFRYIIFEEIIHNNRLSKNKLVIHKELKKLIIILIFIVRLYFLDFDIKLNFNLEIKSCENINDFIFCKYNFDSNITDKIIHKDDKIMTFIF